MAMTLLPIGSNSLSHKTGDDLKIDSSERLLDELVVEYKKQPVPKKMGENAKLIQHIRELLGSDQLFLRWLQKLHEDLSDFHNPVRSEARAHDGDALWLNERIRYADWKHGDSNWRQLSAILEEPGMQASTLGFALGRFHGFQLALRINDRALQPLETDPSTCARLGVVMTNPSVFGIQYIDIKARSTKARTTKKMLIAPLGNIFFTKDTSLPASKREWFDTQYVLALEIGNNGRTASFVVVYNLTYWDEIDCKGRSIPVEAKSEGPKLCGEWLKFTVARVHGQDSELLKPDWGAQEEVDLKLQVLSNATTEVVETGVKKTTWAKGALPIGLYPLAKP